MQRNVGREQPASSDHVLHKAPQSIQASHVYVRSQPRTRTHPRPEQTQQLSNRRQGQSQRPGTGPTTHNVPQTHVLSTVQVDSRPRAPLTGNAEQMHMIPYGQHQGPQQRANELNEEARRRLALEVYVQQRAMLEHTVRERENRGRQEMEWRTMPHDGDQWAAIHSRPIVYPQNLQYQAVAHAASLQRRRVEAQLEEDLVQARHEADMVRRRECLELEAEYGNGNAGMGVIGGRGRGRGSRSGRERG